MAKWVIGTRDFDFIIHLKPEDIDQFVENFKEGYYCDKDAVKDAVKRHSLFNIIDHAFGLVLYHKMD